MALSDGKPRTWKELYPYLSKRINPNMATRSYMQEKVKRWKNPSFLELPEQIKYGTGRLLQACLWSMHKQGTIERTMPTNGDGREAIVVKITEKGLEYLRTSKQTAGGVWKEMRHAVEHGWVKFNLEISQEDKP
jgi:hypothetical protein